MKDKEKQTKVFDILDKIEFFQGQRAGRELWNDKSKEVQDKDISDFVRDINYIRSYLQDSVVLSREEYDELTLTKQSIFDMLEEQDDKARKETAKEILERGKYCMPSGLRDWIKERYGVEVEE